MYAISLNDGPENSESAKRERGNWPGRWWSLAYNFVIKWFFGFFYYETVNHVSASAICFSFCYWICGRLFFTFMHDHHLIIMGIILRSANNKWWLKNCVLVTMYIFVFSAIQLPQYNSIGDAMFWVFAYETGICGDLHTRHRPYVVIIFSR
jgi:hypothetical protein